MNPSAISNKGVFNGIPGGLCTVGGIAIPRCDGNGIDTEADDLAYGERIRQIRVGRGIDRNLAPGIPVIIGAGCLLENQVTSKRVVLVVDGEFKALYFE